MGLFDKVVSLAASPEKEGLKILTEVLATLEGKALSAEERKGAGTAVRQVLEALKTRKLVQGKSLEDAIRMIELFEGGSRS